MQDFNKIKEDFDTYISVATIPWSLDREPTKIFNKWALTILSNGELSKFQKIFTKNSYNLIQEFFELVSQYLETNQQKNTWSPIHRSTSEVFSYVLDITRKITKSIDSKYGRSKIVDKYFNIFLGKEEYLLEDGRYITTDGNHVTKIEIDMQVFPPCFVKRHSKTEYRDSIINEIINEDRE